MEHFGTQACVINLHSLTHFSEDIVRFSAPDNYWCTQFGRAVSRYVQQSSNRKYLEKTFARKESQREFLKFHQPGNLNIFRPSRPPKISREKVRITSHLRHIFKVHTYIKLLLKIIRIWVLDQCYKMYAMGTVFYSVHLPAFITNVVRRATTGKPGRA